MFKGKYKLLINLRLIFCMQWMKDSFDYLIHQCYSSLISFTHLFVLLDSFTLNQMLFQLPHYLPLVSFVQLFQMVHRFHLLHQFFLHQLYPQNVFLKLLQKLPTDFIHLKNQGLAIIRVLQYYQLSFHEVLHQICVYFHCLNNELYCLVFIFSRQIFNQQELISF